MFITVSPLSSRAAAQVNIAAENTAAAQTAASGLYILIILRLTITYATSCCFDYKISSLPYLIHIYRFYQVFIPYKNRNSVSVCRIYFGFKSCITMQARIFITAHRNINQTTVFVRRTYHRGIIDFVRFEKGEGLEKREDNFADEVASMVK